MTLQLILHSISEPTRWAILEEIYANPPGITPTIISAKIGVPLDSVSHHLKNLHQTGLITFFRSGASRLYRPNPLARNEFLRLLTLSLKDTQNANS